MGENAEADLGKLELLSTIGFQGKVRNGLICHPNREHLVYAVGQNVVIKNLTTGHQDCLFGHSNTVSCLAMSEDGALLASGQLNYMGFKAEVIVWDFKIRKMIGTHQIHKVKVEAVAFSCNSSYVVSLGGEDCRSVVIWDVKIQDLLCGSPSSITIGAFATQVCCANLNDNVFVTAGKNTLRVWRIDRDRRKLYPASVPLEKVKRDFLCLEMNYNDEFLYCGTSSGDILKVQLNIAGADPIDGNVEMKPKLLLCLAKALNNTVVGDSPLFCLGVTSIRCLRAGGFVVGTGEGLISRVTEQEIFTKHRYDLKIPTTKAAKTGEMAIKRKPEYRMLESGHCRVAGAVSNITIRGNGHQFFVATKTCEIYRVTLTTLECTLLFTCHGAPINDVVFPHCCSDLFATASLESVRIWNVATSQELLRVSVPNMNCMAVFFSYDGRALISGWSDGKIRSHTPESGKLIYIIEDAHQRGVTALAMTSDNLKIVSGGGEGEVRLWDVNPTVQILHAVMKEHKGAVTSIRIKSNDKECVSSGADGSCIIWDLEKFLRIQVVFANTLFQSVCYGPAECQILTCGTDRKIGYWELFDGVQIRELDGSLSGAVNALDIAEDCRTYVTGGCDKMLKVWRYEEGVVTYVGKGHSEEITALKIAPGMQVVVSVSKDGSIYIWKYPLTRN